MQAVISAGGKGTRLGNLTVEVPKALLPIDGKPMILHQLDELKRNDIEKVWILTGHLGDRIKNYLESITLPIPIEIVHEEIPLGTAGGLSFLKGKINEPFFFIYGDLMFSMDLSRMRKYYSFKSAKMVMVVHPSSHPIDSDIININDDNLVQNVIGKNNSRSGLYSNTANAGIYILDPDILNSIPDNSKTDFEKDILPLFIQQGQVYVYRSSEYIRDMGTLDRLERVEKDYNSGLLSERRLTNKQKAIFLDRDGTINKYVGLLYKIDQFELIESAVEAIGMINQSGYLCFVVTNQPVVARNLCSFSDVVDINKYMEMKLGESGVYVDDIRFCPHHPDKGYPEENVEYKLICRCRKPQTGMIDDLISFYNIERSRSWIIGDSSVDIQTGMNAGLSSILVLSGEEEKEKKFFSSPDYIEADILQAVKRILLRSKHV